MGTALLEEGDARRAAPAEGIAETGDELETRRAAAYDPDMREAGFPVLHRIGHWRRCRDIERDGRYSAAITAGSTRAAQNLNSGILPNGSSWGLVRILAAASA